MEVILHGAPSHDFLIDARKKINALLATMKWIFFEIFREMYDFEKRFHLLFSLLNASVYKYI